MLLVKDLYMMKIPCFLRKYKCFCILHNFVFRLSKLFCIDVFVAPCNKCLTFLFSKKLKCLNKKKYMPYLAHRLYHLRNSCLKSLLCCKKVLSVAHMQHSSAKICLFCFFIVSRLLPC